MKTNTAKSLYSHIIENLGMLDEAEREPVAYWLLEWQGISRAAVLTNAPLTEEQQFLPWQEYLNRLNAHEPIQYLVGETEFYRRNFYVSPSVLIPRPETEEMVYRLLQTAPTEKKHILDVGTGSGCIAISLAAERPNWQVTAMDVSAEALAVARRNGARHKITNIEFWQEDFLKLPPPPAPLDYLVSNPPYIRQTEEATMAPNVLDFEPALALFVPDTTPLLFYEALAVYAQRHVVNGGSCWFEINESLGHETLQLFQNEHFSEAELLPDTFGRDRFIRAKRS